MTVDGAHPVTIDERYFMVLRRKWTQ